MTLRKQFHAFIAMASLTVVELSLAAAGRTVFLISLDGFQSSYLLNDLHTLSRIAKEGAVAQSLIPAFPSFTFPNHMTLVTGCPPGRHGIVANRFLDKQKDEFAYLDDPTWLTCEPIWVTAERQHVSTAVTEWPMSYRPWHGVEATFHRSRYDGRQTDEDILNAMVQLASQHGPKKVRLILGHLPGPDQVGHIFGPESSQVKESNVKLDAAIGRFLSKISAIKGLGPYTILLVSDHGMAEVKSTIDVQKLGRNHPLGGVYVLNGPLLFLYLWEPARQFEMAKWLDGIAQVDAFAAKDPRWPENRWGLYHPRMGDVVALARPSFVFGKGGTSRKESKGAHGYEASDPSMAGVLVAWGDGVARKKIQRAHAVDVAATISHLLGIDPPKDNQGNVIDILERDVHAGQEKHIVTGRQ